MNPQPFLPPWRIPRTPQLESFHQELRHRQQQFQTRGRHVSEIGSLRSFSGDHPSSPAYTHLVSDHSAVVFRQAEEIRRLRRQLLEVANERDALLCEVHHLKMEILASELGRLGESMTMLEESMHDDHHTGQATGLLGPSHVNMGTGIDEDLERQGGAGGHHQMRSIYSSSEMTRLSTSSSSTSSSTSSSPVLFNAPPSSKSISSSSSFNNQQQQFLLHHHHHHHDSSEDTGETGVLERHYGGPPARDAALVIQRAFRRYSMVKEFQRIKTERRLSRRINNNHVVLVGGPTPPPGTTPPGTNEYSICVDLEAEVRQRHDVDGHVEDGMCDVVGDEEDSSTHSGEHSRSPCPDTDGLVRTQDGTHCNGHVSRGQGQWVQSHQPTSPIPPHIHPSHSSPQILLGNGGGIKTELPTSDSSMLQQVGSSRHPPNLVSHHPYHHHQAHHHPTAYHSHHQFNSVPPPPPPHQYFHHVMGSTPTGVTVTPNGTLHKVRNSQTNSNSSPILQSPAGGTNNSYQHPPPAPPPSRQLTEFECEILRKRLYRVGLNLFNKKPEVGISYLVKRKFLEGTSSSVARFLISRKGLSKQMIGEYLANLQSPFSLSCLEHFANEIDLSSLPVDLSLRRFQSFLRMPGEAQKIERVMETFSRRYAACNPHVISQFRNGADTVFVLAFAIIMLNTDLHTPHLKADRRMKMEDFIRNLRGIDDGADLDRDMLVSIYERIKENEFRTGSDHVTQVMKVQQTIVGKKPNLALPHRRLVCYCRLYEISDITKKEKSGAHQREVFLFNDVLVLTKIFHKKRNSVTYSFRQGYPLAGITLLLFTNQYYDFGLCLKRGDAVLLSLNARNEHDRAKFAEDLREAIAESDEMLRIESISKENRDSGVDVGKLKRFSNSLLDINEQCKPVRRGSCGSLDSGMSISFHSDELQQQQNSQPQSSSLSSQSSCLTTTHPPVMANHQAQGSSCSNSSSNSYSLK